jgi:hypothetical protein
VSTIQPLTAALIVELMAPFLKANHTIIEANRGQDCTVYMAGVLRPLDIYDRNPSVYCTESAKDRLERQYVSKETTSSAGYPETQQMPTTRRANVGSEHTRLPCVRFTPGAKSRTPGTILMTNLLLDGRTAMEHAHSGSIRLRLHWNGPLLMRDCSIADEAPTDQM